MPRSKSKCDCRAWVLKVAASAGSPAQRKVAANLISNFQLQFDLRRTDPQLDMEMDCEHSRLSLSII